MTASVNGSIADVAKRFGPQGQFIANGANFLHKKLSEEVAANSDGITGATTCDYSVHTPGEIIDVLGHVHGPFRRTGGEAVLHCPGRR